MTGRTDRRSSRARMQDAHLQVLSLAQATAPAASRADPASPARDQHRRRQADSGVGTLLLLACRLEGRRLALQCVGGVKSLRTVATAPPGAAAEPGGGCVTLALPSIRRSDAETGELFVERGVPHLREFHSLCAPRPSSWPRLDHAHLPGTRPRCDGETMR